MQCSVLLYRYLYRTLLRNSSYWRATILSILLTVLPLLLAMSVYTEFTPIYCIAASGIVLIGNRLHLRPKKAKEEEEQISLMNGPLKPFLSNYRAAMMLATCTAILAVDFNLFFPVRFAKCEEYGISLMDVGVGGFIFSSALTSAKSRLAESEPSVATPSTKKGSDAATNKSTVAKKRSSWVSRQLQSLKTVIPLLVLGLGRFTVIKAFGYQEHVSEYGMHWNFFMTLAGITLLVTAISVPLSYSSLLASFILIVYHYVLEGMGVAQWIIEAPRDNFFSQNREGILSCWGYFAIYLFGQHIGAYLMQPRTKKQWWRALAYLVAGGLILWLAAFLCLYFLDMQASRRMVNLPYALYTLACNFLIISAFVLVDLVESSRPNPLIDSVATRRNSQLVIFTLVCHHFLFFPSILSNLTLTHRLVQQANLMTGATNVFIGTFNRTVPEAFVIMFAYMVCVSLVSLYWSNVFKAVQNLFSSRR